MQGQGKAPRGEPAKREARLRLITAASEEFALHGYANARVRNIVDLARVNLAAVNYYFGGKQGLYRATLGFLTTRPATRVPPIDRRGRTPEQLLQRRVYRLLDRFVVDSQGSTLGRILAHEAMNPTQHLENVIAESLRPELERIQEILTAIAGPGREDEVRNAAIGVLGQCLLYQFAQPALAIVYPCLPAGKELCLQASKQIAHFTVAGIRTLADERSQGPEERA